MSQTTKALIFDLGNVIVNLNAEKTIGAFSQLGIESPEKIFQVRQQNALCDQHERGEISSQQFCTALQELAHPNTHVNDIREAWCHMIAGIPKEKIILLQGLRDKYKLYALSNTNQMHVDIMDQHLQQEHQIENLDQLFDKCYYSHNLGMRKPEQRIFEHIINDSGHLAEDVIFLDDHPKNIQAASDYGIKSIHVTIDNVAQQVRSI
ncbi:MAG: HAD family phosphatase [Gammaproteobacteria bacterium]|nr:HAD family phosphatase [Gammaproteobacteria bacterium]MCH9743399.1 HAD family phosphatase [Gammaproteobacteria bacterium]